ncbi:membrane-associated progesterone receptor component 1 isoform X2 [Drosophila subpulchrella]|uniref:membrane-associated progesterone receptor component 1 isoform X2 n=1 Tax=Drosophila subpulchrella TaxID=1486046 RepID=UPI0018A1B267|nr:membrane-associated progesterone receptor component 1 isoform X2 [Drosophila subpulchrella]
MAGSSRAMDQSTNWYSSFYNSIKQTPINFALVIVSTIVFFKVARLTRRRCQNRGKKQKVDVGLPPLRKDFTVYELSEYDGFREDGRILVAINFNVYDVSRAVHYYGPEGVYPTYAGRDISRNLIHFSPNEHLEGVGPAVQGEVPTCWKTSAPRRATIKLYR